MLINLYLQNLSSWNNNNSGLLERPFQMCPRRVRFILNLKKQKQKTGGTTIREVANLSLCRTFCMKTNLYLQNPSSWNNNNKNSSVVLDRLSQKKP